MKKNDLKGMPVKELEQKRNELRMELIKLNAQVAMHTQIKNPGQIKRIRKNIAQICTMLKQKEVKEKI